MIIDEIRYLRAKTEELRMDNRVEYQEYVDMCDSCDKIEEMLESTRWIPVSERLPEEASDVIAVTANHLVLFAAYLPEYSLWWSNSMPIEVTHWMPLPEPPEQEVE